LRVWHSLRRTIAIIFKEYKHIWLDPGYFFLTVMAPAVLLTLLSYTFSFDIDDANLAVVNQDQSPQSYEYIRALTADGDITVVETIQSYDQVDALFKASKIDAALVIPPGFQSDLDGGQETPVNVVVDATDTGTAMQIANAIRQRSSAYADGLEEAGTPPFDVRIRVWFNPNLDSQHSMIPGLMALVLILPAMTVALGVTREKERGTFEMLITTPILGREYLIGKIVVHLSMALVGTLPALAVAVYWFGVPFRGSLALYLLLTADYIFALMGFCLFVAHFVHNQRAVTSIILLTLFIPSFFQTGLLLPVDTSSIVPQVIAFGLPATHFIALSRGITLKALTMTELLPEALILLGMGIAATLINIALFTKKVR
jgi:ABC-2 type transport system permease protein